MQALLIVAHGSRRVESNEEVRALAAQVAQYTTQTYGIVSSAFLELAEPSIPDGIQQCIDQGAQTVTVMPFFLSAGRHVVTDVPALVHQKQQAYPHIRIQIAPYLGAASSMPQWIAQLAAKACACTGERCTYPVCIKTDAT